VEMYFCPLFSGSSGNSLFCQYGNTRVLIDAGKPGKQIEDALNKIGVDPETISGILITHEHSDHISGVGVLARRYQIPLYATAGTWEGMQKKIGKIPGDLRREIMGGRDFYLGDMGVVPFTIPHDAAEPVGFRLYGGKLSVSTATDLGHFAEDVYEEIAGSSLILLESNHDPEMLKVNPHYSAMLKHRILSDFGHLSNEACSQALLRLISAGTGTILLGHLSAENNTPERAMEVNGGVLERDGIRVGVDVDVTVAKRDEPGDVYCIKEK